MEASESFDDLECRLDGAAFATCEPSVSYRHLATGHHTFEARATFAGLADPTPASFDWTIAPDAPETPEVASFAPTKGPVGTKATTVTGSAFAAPATVTIGSSSPATATVSSPTKLTFLVPPGSRTNLVTVTTAGGDAFSKTVFTVTPTITSFSPHTIKAGDTVTVSGANLEDDPGLVLDVAGAQMPFVADSSTHGSFVFPFGNVGGLLRVTTQYGSFATTDKLALLAAMVPPFNPDHGSSGGSVGLDVFPPTGLTSVRFTGYAGGAPSVPASSFKVLRRDRHREDPRRRGERPHLGHERRRDDDECRLVRGGPEGHGPEQVIPAHGLRSVVNGSGFDHTAIVSFGGGPHGHGADGVDLHRAEDRAAGRGQDRPGRGEYGRVVAAGRGAVLQGASRDHERRSQPRPRRRDRGRRRHEPRRRAGNAEGRVDAGRRDRRLLDARQLSGAGRAHRRVAHADDPVGPGDGPGAEDPTRDRVVRARQGGDGHVRDPHRPHVQRRVGPSGSTA